MYVLVAIYLTDPQQWRLEVVGLQVARDEEQRWHSQLHEQCRRVELFQANVEQTAIKKVTWQ